jgi:hypothetical protein
VNCACINSDVFAGLDPRLWTSKYAVLRIITGFFLCIWGDVLIKLHAYCNSQCFTCGNREAFDSVCSGRLFVFIHTIFTKSRFRYISELCNLWVAITEAICKLNVNMFHLNLFTYWVGMYCGSYKCIHIFEVTCLGQVTISE